jgi:hypothetical protein
MRIGDGAEKVIGKSQLSSLKALIGYLRLILGGIPHKFLFVSVLDGDRFLSLGLILVRLQRCYSCQ